MAKATISNLLYVCAWINICHYSKGKQLINYRLDIINNNGIEFMNAIINFSGVNGKMNQA